MCQGVVYTVTCASAISTIFLGQKMFPVLFFYVWAQEDSDTEALLALRRVHRTLDRVRGLECCLFVAILAGLVTYISVYLAQALIEFIDKEPLIFFFLSC